MTVTRFAICSRLVRANDTTPRYRRRLLLASRPLLNGPRLRAPGIMAGSATTQLLDNKEVRNNYGRFWTYGVGKGRESPSDLSFLSPYSKSCCGMQVLAAACSSPLGEPAKCLLLAKRGRPVDLPRRGLWPGKTYFGEAIFPDATAAD